MGYCKLSYKCMRDLAINYENYINECIRALDEITNTALRSYQTILYNKKNLARHKEYSTKCLNAKEWNEKNYKKLIARYNEFIEFFKSISNDRYTRLDHGYLIKYDFHTMTKTREYDYTVPSDKFRIRFTGESRWYELNYYRKDMKLILPPVEFDKFSD